MFKRVWNYLGTEHLGFVESVIALYPILAGYGYGSIKLSFVVLLFLDIIILFKGKVLLLRCKPLLLFSVFIILHDLIWLTVIPEVTSYFVNSLISTIIFLSSIFIISPQIDFGKLRKAIYICAIICMIGMFYHIAMLAAGYVISPIKFPFLPEMARGARLYSELSRPTSFFWEPQSYASFMLVPMFFALNEKKVIFALLIAITVFASTSTTGLFLSILMFLTFVFKKGNGWGGKIFIIVTIVGLIYFLFNSSYTEASLNKIENTNLEETNRTINGLLIAQNMSITDLILGIPFPNEQDAYDCRYINAPLVIHSDGVVFVSAFWISLIRYGIIASILLMSIYLWMYLKCKVLLPYLICTVVALFSNPDFLVASFCFQIFVMLATANSKKNVSKKYAFSQMYRKSKC